jgi:hypothetical protein
VRLADHQAECATDRTKRERTEQNRTRWVVVHIIIAMEEEDTELEEGEAKEPCDPDKDFSYIDQKLYLLLGDQQKEFQGCTISTQKLGSKFGGYGTFLPTQARAPSMLANPLRPSHVLEPADSNKEVMELLPFLFYMLFSLAKSGGTSHWC